MSRPATIPTPQPQVSEADRAEIEHYCNDMADYALGTALDRDQGYSRAWSLASTHQMAAQKGVLRELPDLERVVHAVYDAPNLSPGESSRAMYRLCVQRAHVVQ